MKQNNLKDNFSLYTLNIVNNKGEIMDKKNIFTELEEMAFEEIVEIPEEEIIVGDTCE